MSLPFRRRWRRSWTANACSRARRSKISTFYGADVEAGATRRPAAFAGLTDREFEVAELIARGLDNKEIAATAYMGEGTVRNHISSILAKMGLRNRTQIAIAYLRG